MDKDGVARADKHTNFAAEKFLEFLIQGRQILMQGAALMQLYYPDHEVWQTPAARTLFGSAAFKDFQQEVLNNCAACAHEDVDDFTTVCHRPRAPRTVVDVLSDCLASMLDSSASRRLVKWLLTMARC